MISKSLSQNSHSAVSAVSSLKKIAIQHSVLFVSEFYPPNAMGGGELSAHLLAKNLVSRGIHVEVLTTNVSNAPSHEIIDGVVIHRTVAGGNPKSFAGNVRRLRTTIHFSIALKHLLSETSFDIIHALNITTMPAVANAKTFALKFAHINSPLIVCPKATKIRYGKECTVNCSFFKYFLPCIATSDEIGRIDAISAKINPIVLATMWNRWKMIINSLSAFNHFFPISNYLASWLLRYGVPKSKITVVHNIIEKSSFIQNSKEDNKKKNKKKILKIIYLGSLLRSKGVHVLLEAFSRLNNSDSKVNSNIKANSTIKTELDIFGSGPLLEKLKRDVKIKSLSVNFNNDVPHKNVNKIIAQHDILVFPSIVPEAFGRVAAEAFATGIPVIASNVGGISDIVENNKNGFLVKPGNVEELVTALERLLSDASLREKFASHGKLKVAREFSEKNITTLVMKKYGWKYKQGK